MTVEYVKTLLAMAEDMLAIATTLPSGPTRTDAVQTIRDYVANIALLINAIEIGLKEK